MNKKRKTKTQKSKINKRFITAGLFIAFSSILFFNNLTQALSNFVNLTTFQINVIAWLGIIGSVIYTIYKVTGGEM